MTNQVHKHFFPIVDAMVAEAVRDVAADGIAISCRKGCNHCCHLLIEISWEEAMALATWVLAQPKAQREAYRSRIKANADNAKALFKTHKNGALFAKPYGADEEIPDALYDSYFYDEKRPCPFLIDGLCSTYEKRPSSCRLHMVSSPPALCASDVTDDTDYTIPDRIEELREEVAPINTAVSQDGRWGHMGILVAAALEALTSENHT